MVAELTALRDQIDEVDKALLSLLAKRLELVAEVGEVKSKYGLPIYVPEREASMLASRRKEAAALGVPPDLIEDVLRRVMRESYSSENDKGFKTLCPSLRPVVIVGGVAGIDALKALRAVDVVGAVDQPVGIEHDNGVDAHLAAALANLFMPVNRRLTTAEVFPRNFRKVHRRHVRDFCC